MTPLRDHDNFTYSSISQLRLRELVQIEKDAASLRARIYTLQESMNTQDIARQDEVGLRHYFQQHHLTTMLLHLLDNTKWARISRPTLTGDKFEVFTREDVHAILKCLGKIPEEIR